MVIQQQLILLCSIDIEMFLGYTWCESKCSLAKDGYCYDTEKVNFTLTTEQSFSQALVSNSGRKGVTLEEKRKLGGGYNSFMQTSLPEEFRCYNPAEETIDSSHMAFTKAFPRGFALEILQVYSGPPVITYKFRHWGFKEGPFKGHNPTGEMVELHGMAVFEVPSTLKT